MRLIRLRRACLNSPPAKVFGSEAAVRVITDLVRVVGIDSWAHELPLARLLQDAVVCRLSPAVISASPPHALMLDPAYDHLATLDSTCLAKTARP
jgi:hypothetical protein